MLPPLPRRGDWRHHFAHPSSRISLPRYGCRVGPRIDLFEACSAFTRVAACTLALPPYVVARLSEGFRHFVTSMPAPVASGWSDCRVGFAPTGKRRLFTAHARGSRSPMAASGFNVATKRPRPVFHCTSWAGRKRGGRSHGLLIRLLKPEECRRQWLARGCPQVLMIAFPQ